MLFTFVRIQKFFPVLAHLSHLSQPFQGGSLGGIYPKKSQWAPTGQPVSVPSRIIWPNGCPAGSKEMHTGLQHADKAHRLVKATQARA